MFGRWFGGCFMAFWMIGWGGGTLAADGFLIAGIGRQLRAVGFPTTFGTVTHSSVKISSDSEGTSYHPEIRYEYALDGARFIGDRYRYTFSTSGKKSAEQAVAVHPVGRTVTVYYNPADPSDSVLQPGMEGGDLLVGLFLLPFNLVAVGSGWFVWHAWRKPAPNVAFGGFKVTERDGCRHVLLNDPRLMVAGLTAMVLSIVVVIVVGIGTGFQPPLAVGAMAWVVVLAGAVLGYHWARPGRNEPGELILDPVGTLGLASLPGAKPERVIEAAAVTAIVVETKEEKDSEGDMTRYYIPTLHFKDAGRMEQRQPLGRWTDESQAETLAASLRQWLQTPTLA